MDSVPLSYTKWTAPACMHVLPYEPCHNSIKLFETCKKWHKFSLFICPIHFVTNRTAFVDFDLYGTGQAVNKVSLNDHVSLTCKCIDLVNQSECLLVWWLSSTCKFHSLIRYGQENCIGGGISDFHCPYALLIIQFNSALLYIARMHPWLTMEFGLNHCCCGLAIVNRESLARHKPK